VCAGQRLCADDGFRSLSTVGINAESGIPASGGALPKSARLSQGNDVNVAASGRLSPPTDDRPISRKMSRKQKKAALRSGALEKKSQVEHAEADKATPEIPSKVIEMEPTDSKPIVAPALIAAQKVVVKNATGPLSKADPDQPIKAVVAKEPSALAVPKASVAKGVWAVDSERRPVSKGDRPISRKMVQSYKVNFTQYKANATDAVAESAPVCTSWASVVSKSKQGPTTRGKSTRCCGQSIMMDVSSKDLPKKIVSDKACLQDLGSTTMTSAPSSKVCSSKQIRALAPNDPSIAVQKSAFGTNFWPSLDSAKSTASMVVGRSNTLKLSKVPVANVVMGTPSANHAEVSREPKASRDEEGGEEHKFTRVTKKRTYKKIYKNNMTKEEYLNWLEQEIFERGMLDSVSANWCLDQELD